MSLHPDYLTDDDRVRICGHWLRRTIDLTTEGVEPTAAPGIAAQEMRMGESLLRGWTLRLMSQALIQGQASARLNAMRETILRTPEAQPCAD